MRNLSKNVEILPSKRPESHSQSENGLKRPFGVKNDNYGPYHGADFYKNDTLSRSRNPENDTLFSDTSPYGKIYEYPPPRALVLQKLALTPTISTNSETNLDRSEGT